MFEKGESCGVCGGDGRISNAFGATKTCPGCSGSGRRGEDFGFRDVTKTKAAQGRGPAGATADREKDGKVFLSADGAKLAREVRDCTHLSDAAKAALMGEITQYEATHGGSTSTFQKKIRKRLRPGA